LILKNEIPERKHFGLMVDHVEIQVEFDSGFVCVFVPDFRVSSKADTSDYSALCRRLSGAEVAADMGILPGTISKKHSIHATSIGDTDV